jgi:hypothetical protein
MYVERDDYEEVSYTKNRPPLAYLAQAVQHFREVYGQPTFLVRLKGNFLKFLAVFILNRPPSGPMIQKVTHQ